MSDGGRPKHFSLLRSFALADVITLGNAASGMGAILLSVAYVAEGTTALMWIAFGLFPAALACDVADGMVARWRRRSSSLGADLDSLAELIYFVACGVSRLARFNVTSVDLADERGKVRYFEGTPIPSSVLIVLVLSVAFGVHGGDVTGWGGAWQLGPWVLHPLSLLYVLNGTTMISGTLRIPKP